LSALSEIEPTLGLFLFGGQAADGELAEAAILDGERALGHRRGSPAGAGLALLKVLLVAPYATVES
jgi:hypothetical protein